MELEANRDEVTGRWHLSGVEPDDVTFNNIIEMLKNWKAFKFARYGDGEIYCMNDKPGSNCDGHQYFADLGERLRKAVASEPEYMVGIQPLSVNHLNDSVQKYFGKYQRLYNADVLHSASIDGKMNVLFKALEGRHIILVGPPHLANLFDCVHIVIPEKNCWLHYDQIIAQIGFHITGIDNAVVLLCASMMSEVIIHDFADVRHTFIDTGSVFDPYTGVNSRRYHHKLNRKAS